MWKAVLLVVALIVAGHFAVRYLRTNPLSPVIEGGELVVETTEHTVRFALEGAFEGTYLIASAQSTDFGDEPTNAKLDVVGFGATREYLGAHPDRTTYGSVSEQQLDNLSSSLFVIAANRVAYGDLQVLLDRFESRVASHGKWLCVTLSGDALGVSSATSTLRGTDATSLFEKRIGGQRMLLATRVRLQDCEERLEPS
jgi:hypothetical protein